jgi:hypothetical protein
LLGGLSAGMTHSLRRCSRYLAANASRVSLAESRGPRRVDSAGLLDTEVHANNPIETDHGRLKARLRPMRGLKTDRTARVVVAGHAFIQNPPQGLLRSRQRTYRLLLALLMRLPNWPWRSDTDPSGWVHRTLASANATLPLRVAGGEAAIRLESRTCRSGRGTEYLYATGIYPSTEFLLQWLPTLPGSLR